MQFVIATNLAPLTDDILAYCRAHGILISTSLDGPRELHNLNRPRPGGDSHELVEQGIRRVRDALGPDRIAALMTTTAASLSCPREIIDEYVRLGLLLHLSAATQPLWVCREDGHCQEVLHGRVAGVLPCGARLHH